MANPHRRHLGVYAAEEIADLFASHGWKVHREPPMEPVGPDLLIQKGSDSFLVEIKVAPEGRADRVIPLLSQAVLQAKAYSRQAIGKAPLAVVFVRQASNSLLKQVQSFSKRFAPDVAIGIVSQDGARFFSGDALGSLNAEPSESDRPRPSAAPQLFSDLNQWMLKVLLAPEIPNEYLSAPRSEYRNASELAKAANVSVMSAFRFLEILREDGFMERRGQSMRLVRRKELFRRWELASLRPASEISLMSLIRNNASEYVKQLASRPNSCLGLFAAAERLHLGHVVGVPAHVLVWRLSEYQRQPVQGFARSSPGERVDVIVRQAPFPQSAFRGAVHRDGVVVSDVLQVWLDVSAHPARGREQAALIYREVLQKVAEASGNG